MAIFLCFLGYKKVKLSQVQFLHLTHKRQCVNNFANLPSKSGCDFRSQSISLIKMKTGQLIMPTQKISGRF